MRNCATLLSLILIALLHSGCARVRIDDAEFCGDMGSEGAQCFNLLSDKEREIPKPQWDEERFGMICTEAQTFVEWKKAIIKLCRVSGRCYYDTTEMAVKFGDRVDNFTEFIHGEQHENTQSSGAGNGRSAP